MATVKIINAGKFIDKLEKANVATDELIDYSLEKTAKIAFNYVKKNLQEAENSDALPRYMKPGYAAESSGLSGHLGISPIQIDEKGFRNIKVGFAGTITKYSPVKKKGIRIKAAYLAKQLEYGAADYNIPCRPWLRPAIKQSRKKINDALRDYFTKDMSKLLK